MQPKRTSKYIISLLLVVCVGLKMSAGSKEEVKLPLYRDFALEADISSLYSLAFEKDNYKEFMAAARVNLKGKYFPTIEAGYAYATKSTFSDIVFETAAPFVKAGVGVNILKNNLKKGHQNLFLIGLNGGMSNFAYNVQDIVISDAYWGEVYEYDKHIQTTRFWYEISANMRVMLSENIFTGWSLINRHLIGGDEAGSFKPLYIPGYGINESKNWKFNYVIGIRF